MASNKTINVQEVNALRKYAEQNPDSWKIRFVKPDRKPALKKLEVKQKIIKKVKNLKQNKFEKLQINSRLLRKKSKIDHISPKQAVKVIEFKKLKMSLGYTKAKNCRSKKYGS